MAKLQFFKGALTGKLGEFVGSKWKGINYLRMFAKPANPRTEDQVSVRAVFASISAFASALYAYGLLEVIPPAKRMTERNTVFKANKKMFTDKVFVPSALQVSKPNYGLSPTGCSAAFNASTKVLTFTASTTPVADYVDDVKDVHFMLYDLNKKEAVAVATVENFSGTISAQATVPTFNTAGGSAPNDCRLYCFISMEDEHGHKFISSTVSGNVN